MASSTPPPQQREEHATPRRVRVLSAYQDHHWSKRRISREFNIPHTTVLRILKSESPRRTRPSARTGRPRKISERELRRVIRHIRRSYNNRKLPYAQVARECGLNCSGQTVRRALARVGYHKCKACPKPFINKKQRKQRLAWARENRPWLQDDWDKVLWTDEVTFETGKKAKDWIIRTREDRYCEDCCQHRFRSGRTSVTIWAGIGMGWKTDIVFLEGSGVRGGMTMEDYKKQVLHDTCEPALRAMKEVFGRVLLQEDGNKAHGLKNKDMKAFKERLGIEILNDWPPSSPDFNPIENVWRVLKQRLKHRNYTITNKDQLKAAIKEEWDRLQPEEWSKYIRTMQERLKEAVRRHGLATGY